MGKSGRCAGAVQSAINGISESDRRASKEERAVRVIQAAGGFCLMLLLISSLPCVAGNPPAGLHRSRTFKSIAFEQSQLFIFVSINSRSASASARTSLRRAILWCWLGTRENNSHHQMTERIAFHDFNKKRKTWGVVLTSPPWHPLLPVPHAERRSKIGQTRLWSFRTLSSTIINVERVFKTSLYATIKAQYTQQSKSPFICPVPCVYCSQFVHNSSLYRSTSFYSGYNCTYYPFLLLCHIDLRFSFVLFR